MTQEQAREVSDLMSAAAEANVLLCGWPDWEVVIDNILDVITRGR